MVVVVWLSSCLFDKLSFFSISQYDNILMEEAAQILEIETFIPLLLQVRSGDLRQRKKDSGGQCQKATQFWGANCHNYIFSLTSLCLLFYFKPINFL